MLSHDPHILGSTLGISRLLRRICYHLTYSVLYFVHGTVGSVCRISQRPGSLQQTLGILGNSLQDTLQSVLQFYGNPGQISDLILPL